MARIPGTTFSDTAPRDTCTCPPAHELQGGGLSRAGGYVAPPPDQFCPIHGLCVCGHYARQHHHAIVASQTEEIRFVEPARSCAHQDCLCGKFRALSPEQARLDKAESIRVTAENVRLICSRCPAVAVVHYQGQRHSFERLVWAECHGEHFFGTLPDYTVRSAMFAQGREDVDVMLHQLGLLSEQAIADAQRMCEERIEEASKLYEVIERYLIARK